MRLASLVALDIDRAMLGLGFVALDIDRAMLKLMIEES
jgi:hypothetical protein